MRFEDAKALEAVLAKCLLAVRAQRKPAQIACFGDKLCGLCGSREHNRCPPKEQPKTKKDSAATTKGAVQNAVPQQKAPYVVVPSTQGAGQQQWGGSSYAAAVTGATARAAVRQDKSTLDVDMRRALDAALAAKNAEADQRLDKMLATVEALTVTVQQLALAVAVLSAAEQRRAEEATAAMDVAETAPATCGAETQTN